MQSLEFRVFLDGGDACNEAAPSTLDETFKGAEVALRSASDGFEIKVERLGDCSQGQLEESTCQPLCLLVRVCSGDLKAIDFGGARELYDRVLSGEFDVVASRELLTYLKSTPFTIRADRSGLAEHYEKGVLALESLTPHQQEKLQECGVGIDKCVQHIHLHAPAGAGKTFVALHRALEVLQDQSRKSARVLFIARNEALSFFAATWIGKRIQDPYARSHCLERLHVLYEPFDLVRTVSVRRNRVFMRTLSRTSLSPSATASTATSSSIHGDGIQSATLQYDLVIIDEAQHIYSKTGARDLVEAYITEGLTQRLLLSDVSQSLGHEIAYPNGVKDVVLSEVVRCSKRIVAGAMAFQLGGTAKLLTKCHHESTGPPLKSFLFDGPTDGSVDKTNDLYRAYAEQTVRALDHVVSVFPDLSLRNRLALIVPDADFLHLLQPELARALDEHFPLRKFRLVNSRIASSDLGSSNYIPEDGQNCDSDELDDEQSEWLVYDAICNMDGLERLIVIGIGLDAIISSADAHPSEASQDSNEAMPLETRSMLYRAVTRAHLMFVVVNEFLRGGWLEFLGSVSLRDDEAFNSATELKRTQVQAVEDFVKSELTEMITAAANNEGIKLNDAAKSVLATKASAFQEGGQEEHSAVDRVLRDWKSAASMVASIVQNAATKSGLSLPGAEKLDSICAALTLSVLKGDANIPLAATDALKRAIQESRNAQITDALKAALGDHDKDVLSMLSSRVSTNVDRGDSIDAAAKAAVDDWRRMEVQIAAEVKAKLAEMELSVPNDVEKKLCSETAASMCHGEDITQAVEGSIVKWRKSELDAQIAAALESALLHSLATMPICESGSHACLDNLVKKPELNGKQCVVQKFDPSRLRWYVTIHSTKQAIWVKEGNILVQTTADEHGQLRCSKVDAVPLWKSVVSETVDNSMESARLFDTCVQVIRQWRELEARVDSALEVETLARQRHLAAKHALIFKVMQSLWRTSCDSSDYGKEFEAAVAKVLDEWEFSDHIQQEETSRISSELECKAHSKRIFLTDAAKATLLRRVTSALRRGEDLGAAVDAALNEWEKQLVRQKVQQTVWDPSGNLTRKVTGVVRFMPYKQNFRDSFDYWLLPHVFQFLPFNNLGYIGSVCKRWRNAAYDPSWKPELVAYAWGDADVTGLSMRCTKPTLLEFSLAKQVMKISCSDNATFALTEMGTVWFWGQAWCPDEEHCQEPTRIHELDDVISISVSPPGYHHGRRFRDGYGCLAVTRQGALYAWGRHKAVRTLTQDNLKRPYRITTGFDAWQPLTERVLHAACGLDYIALGIERCVVEEQGTRRTPAVIACGSFCGQASLHNGEPYEWEELRGITLRQLEAGCFHCCALTTKGELYTFGDELGMDHANGNLLGHGEVQYAGIRTKPPRKVEAEGLGPIAEVSCSSYTTIAITIDGRVFSWGDCDGDSLGHGERTCHRPAWLKSLRWQTVTHGALSYTNGAVATDDGHVFVWGGNMWEGGIAAGRNARGPSEVQWNGVPSCYQVSSVALAHRHGYLIFRKRP